MRSAVSPTVAHPYTGNSGSAQEHCTLQRLVFIVPLAPNAGPQPRLPAFARTSLRLADVGCRPMLNEALRAVFTHPTAKPVLKDLLCSIKRLYLLYSTIHHPACTGGIAMTPLRQRMIEDLQLRGLSERTQEMYVQD